MARTALLLAAVLLAGCGSGTTGPPDPGHPRPAPAVGIRGEYVGDGLPGPFDAGDVLRLTFGVGVVGFTTGCNGHRGAATWDDGVLRVDGLVATELGCPGDGNAEDEWLADFLTSRPEISVDGTDVRLTGGGHELWLVPAAEVAPEPGPDTPLQGTTWRLVGIEVRDGDAADHRTVPPPRPRLRLSDGRVRFDTSCNDGGGGVTVLGQRIVLRRVAVTLVGCTDGRGGVERGVLAVLGQRTAQWSVTGRELRLGHGDTSLLYRSVAG